MRWSAWGALACAAVVIACDARGTDRYDDSPAAIRDSQSTTERDGLDNDVAQSGPVVRPRGLRPMRAGSRNRR